MPLFDETAEKVASARRLFWAVSGAGGDFRLGAQPFLCGFGVQGGRDRVEVDENGGPEDLQA